MPSPDDAVQTLSAIDALSGSRKLRTLQPLKSGMRVLAVVISPFTWQIRLPEPTLMAQYPVVQVAEPEGRKDKIPCILPHVVFIRVRILLESELMVGDRIDGSIMYALADGDMMGPGRFFISLERESP